jgi:hypothetical protein
LQHLLADPKAYMLDKCMDIIITQTFTSLSWISRDIPQVVALVVVGNTMVGQLSSTSEATSSVEQGWLIFKALEKLMYEEPAIGHVDEYVDMRIQIKEILTLADGAAKDRILLLLAHVVCIYFDILQNFI